MPEGTARADFGARVARTSSTCTSRSAPGRWSSSQLPTALSPNAPETIDVQTPPATSAVRQSVQADVNTIFLALGGVALLIGGVGIANVTLLSVLERVGEIGLRRALGATRRDIGAQFMVESVVVGLLGGHARAPRSGSRSSSGSAPRRSGRPSSTCGWSASRPWRAA